MKTPVGNPGGNPVLGPNEPHCASVPIGQLTENVTVPVGGTPPMGGLDSTNTLTDAG